MTPLWSCCWGLVTCGIWGFYDLFFPGLAQLHRQMTCPLSEDAKPFKAAV